MCGWKCGLEVWVGSVGVLLVGVGHIVGIVLGVGVGGIYFYTYILVRCLRLCSCLCLCLVADNPRGVFVFVEARCLWACLPTMCQCCTSDNSHGLVAIRTLFLPIHTAPHTHSHTLTHSGRTRRMPRKCSTT